MRDSVFTRSILVSLNLPKNRITKRQKFKEGGKRTKKQKLKVNQRSPGNTDRTHGREQENRENKRNRTHVGKQMN